MDLALVSLWTLEQKADMIQMFNDKNSMGVIADKYQTTRSAIAGIIRRERERGVLEVRATKARSYGRENMPTVHKWKKTLQQPALKTVAVIPMSTPEPKVKRARVRLIEDQEVCLLDLKAHHCRWPKGDPRSADFRFCGQYRPDDKGPYCAEHSRLAYREPQPRRDTRRHYR